MARIDGVSHEKAGIMTRIAYWFGKRRVGQVPEPVTVYAHSPWLMRAYGAFELCSERADRVDKRLKFLASIKTSSIVGCPW